MSFKVILKYLEGVREGYEIFIKVTFRDKEFKSIKYKKKSSIFFGQTFSWPIARKLEKTDILIIKCYASPRYTSHKLLGHLNLLIASMITQPFMSFRENLLDKEFRILDIILEFEIDYLSPVAGFEKFSENDFYNPAFNLSTLKREGNRVKLPSESSSEFDMDDHDDDFKHPESNMDIDNDSDISLLPTRDYKLPKHIDPSSLKILDFEISITIVEAQGLTGKNINPMFEIYCGKQKKETELKMQTNTPFYNEYFSFDFRMSRVELMEQIIIIKAVTKRSHIVTRHIFSGKVIGEFSIDAKTVYSNDNHSFFQKWAVLLDPKAPTSGTKGYVKVDISVLCSGDKPKRPVPNDKEENSNIEGNLLIPKCVSSIDRKICEMAILIYQAEDLPCMNTNLLSNMKHAILGENKALTDPYVEVSFAGFTGRTKVINKTYFPDWNQQIIFTERFPPYVNRIRIAVRDNDMVKDETISTVFIDLHKIMYVASENEDFLPTYGPSWINLYGTPRTYSYIELIKGDKGQNQNLAEGVAFRGRLLMAIKTTIQSDSSKLGVEVRPSNPVSNAVAGKREMYLLFGTIFETTLINEEIGKKNKPITFEMSIGTTGNIIDDTLKPLPGKESENQYVHSLTEPKYCYTFDNKYFHIPYRNRKPCLFMITQGEDHRSRMFIPNILEKLKLEMSENIRQTNYIMERSTRAKARQYLSKRINVLCENIKKVSVAMKSCKETAKKTMLDVKYQRVIRLELQKMSMKLHDIKIQLSRKNITEKLKDYHRLVKLVEDKMSNPQHGLPDVFIYMLQENTRIAYTRIAARDILYSVVSEERGHMSGVINTIYLKKMDNSILETKTNYNIQAQMQLYIWLGLLKDMRAYKMGIPEGYNKDCFIEKLPPTYIDYSEESLFQLRIYLYMGRNLIGSDESGLSDPFVRIIIGEHVKKSSVIMETRSPMWDETIIIDEIIFNYEAEVVKSSPPYVVLELFDWDSDTDDEFIGRVFCQPTVFISGDQYVPSKLQWWNIFRGTLTAGDILAAFDLIEVNAHSKKTQVQDLPSIKDIEEMSTKINLNSMCKPDDDKLRIPYDVRPVTKAFRFEVVIWGVRQLKRLEIFPVKRNGIIPIKRMGIFPVNKPRITVEIAGYKIESEVLNNWSKQPNFQDNLFHIDLRLPENTQFWPPVSISCSNLTIFGIEQCVGNCVITNLVQYYQIDEYEDDAEIDKTTVDEELSNADNQQKNGLENLAFEDKEVERISNKVEDNINHDVTANHPGMPQKVQPKIPSEEKESADWWTRYYTTIGELNKDKPEVERISESDSEDELLPDLFSDNSVEVALASDEEDDVVLIEEDTPKKKQKKKKKKKKKKKRKLINFKKKAKALYLKEIEDVDNDENEKFEIEVVSDNFWIDRIKIYPCELENVKDFGGFNFPVKSFPLFRGKEEEDEDEYNDYIYRFAGAFKGNICIYSIDSQNADFKDSVDNYMDIENENNDEEEDDNEDEDNLSPIKIEFNDESLRLFRSRPDNKSMDFIVRVYVVRGINLHPADLNGKADPYILVKLGDQEIRDREHYIPKTLNPIFGACFELEVTFPQESYLLVQVYDWDRLTKDDLIGETAIDLENRWLSPHRGTCGLMPNYHNHGFLKWKDNKLPSAILKSMCEQYDIPAPKFDQLAECVQVGDHIFNANTLIEDDDGSMIKSIEPLALQALLNWDEIFPNQKLVPEHIETRPLYLSDKPGIEQGLLEMWVDMFPSGGALSPPIDISPRIPVGYELRITIIKTEKVRLTDENFFTKEKSADIYLKAWMKSTDIDLQETDVHYRSLSGQGLFNWRFVFKFDYLKAEDIIVYQHKHIYEIDENEYKTPCFLNMQVLDSDLLMSDTIIGALKFRLSKFPRPAKYYKSCDPFQHEDACAKFNLFRNKKARGWWPLIYNLKDEDPEEDDEKEIGGTVEMELELLLAEEAESNPAGLGRDEPLPLEKPNRPDGSFLSFLNPLQTIKYFIKYRLKWCLIKFLIILIFVLILVLFIYNFPGNFTRVIVDKISG